MLLKKIKVFFKNYYGHFHLWSQSIPIDAHIDEVKKQLPDYVTVDWENPKTLGNGFLYRVTKIKGHAKTASNDFIGFVNDLYSGHVFIK